MTEGDDRDWARLARKAKERRAELGDPPIMKIMQNAGTWRRLVNYVEPDPNRRAKAGPLSDAKLRELERGLDWGVKAADTVLAGGDPWLAEEEPDLPEGAEGIWIYFKGGEVRALLPDDPARNQRLIEFIRRHGQVVDLND